VFVFDAATQLLALVSICVNLYVVAFGFDETPPNLWAFIQLLEIVYGIEIFLHFFTTYKDPETFVTVNSLKQIAVNYITNGTFIIDLLAFFPFQVLFDLKKIAEA
jgi:hypothetical protein